MVNGKELFVVREKISLFEQVNLFAISFKRGNLLKAISSKFIVNKNNILI